MTRKRLNRLIRKLDELRSAPANITSDELISIAKSLGRRRKKKRSGEPMYLSNIFPQLGPLPIPSHPGTLKRFTALSVLNQLDEDILQWEEYLSSPKKQTEKGLSND